METKDIVTILLERGNSMQTYWGFFITVSLGLLVFFGNAAHTLQLPYIAALATVAFIGFAYVNCSALMQISNQRNFLWKTLSEIDASKKEAPPYELLSQFDKKIAAGIVEKSKPDSPKAVFWFHIASDCILLVVIWAFTLWSGSMHQNSL